MVASLDGFIANKDNTVEWLKSVDTYESGTELTEEYITEFLKSIDCYVMGSKTYEHAVHLGWPYGEKPVYVLTRRNLSSDKESVNFYKGDLKELVHKILTPKYQNIWMVGGAMLTKKFIRLKLVDEIILSIMPVILGDGKLFFDYVGEEQLLHLKNVTAYKDGRVELTYEIKKDSL